MELKSNKCDTWVVRVLSVSVIAFSRFDTVFEVYLEFCMFIWVFFVSFCFIAVRKRKVYELMARWYFFQQITWKNFVFYFTKLLTAAINGPCMRVSELCVLQFGAIRLWESVLCVTLWYIRCSHKRRQCFAHRFYSASQNFGGKHKNHNICICDRYTQREKDRGRESILIVIRDVLIYLVVLLVISNLIVVAFCIYLSFVVAECLTTLFSHCSCQKNERARTHTLSIKKSYMNNFPRHYHDHDRRHRRQNVDKLNVITQFWAVFKQFQWVYTYNS